METIIVQSARGEYPLFIGLDSLDQLGGLIDPLWAGKKAVIVSDSNVAPLYAKTCRRALARREITSQLVQITPGETSKNLKTLDTLYTAFFEHGLSRSDAVIALGGGVVGDLAGFAAATYLRGVPHFQVPTTLLAQVDSAIGGKTAIDTAWGKNLVGAFYPPRAVVVDPNTLSTLAPPIFAQGMAEVIKYGCILDRELFESLEHNEFDRQNVVSRSAALKAAVVGQDEYDRGSRQLLNFGHTIGHALEKALDYTGIAHGEAVAIGMVLALKVGEVLGLTGATARPRLVALLAKWNLPSTLPVAPGAVIAQLGADKKRRGERINFILVKELGEAMVHPIGIPQLSLILEEVASNG